MVEGQIENYSLAASNGRRLISIKALLRNKTPLYYYYYYYYIEKTRIAKMCEEISPQSSHLSIAIA